MRAPAQAPAENTKQQASSQQLAQVPSELQPTIADTRPEMAQLKSHQAMMGTSPQQQNLQALQARMAQASQLAIKPHSTVLPDTLKAAVEPASGLGMNHASNGHGVVMLAKKKRKASREANRRMGLDARGRTHVRLRTPPARLAMAAPGGYGYKMLPVRVNGHWVPWRVLVPGGFGIFSTGLMPYQGTRVADYAHANGLRGMPQPPGTVWHHLHDWRPGGGANGRGSLVLMLTHHHSRFHRGGVEQCNKYRIAHGLGAPYV